MKNNGTELIKMSELCELQAQLIKRLLLELMQFRELSEEEAEYIKEEEMKIRAEPHAIDI